jgi:hypothetical protein
MRQSRSALAFAMVLREICPQRMTIPAKPPTDSGINPPADSGDNSPTHSGVISPGGTGACWRWNLTVVLGGGQSSSVRL